MAQDVQEDVKSLHSLTARKKLFRKFHDKGVCVAADSNSGFLARHGANNTHLHCTPFYGAVDGMKTGVVAS
jgi:hypothetical protein